MSKGPTDVVLVTAGYDHCIKYWNVVDCVCTHSIQHNESVCRSVCLLIVYYHSI